jgi:ComF family protein
MHRLGLRLRSLLDLVFESACPLCQRSTEGVFCLDCQRQIQRCQLPPGREWQAGQWQAGQPEVFAWGSYSGALKRAIAALKYENHPSSARPLGHWLAQAWLAANPAPPKLTVVPIPLHADKLQQRGFNQAALLAESFCEMTHLPLERQGLERQRTTEAQFGLSAEQREQNLVGAFNLGKGFLNQPPDNPVLLLDDIYTSGATARSAIQTLRRHGIRVKGIVALARAVKQN